MTRYGLKHFESILVGESSSEGDDQEGALIVVLKGPLNTTRLQESLDRALLQHSALRARLIRQGQKDGKSPQWTLASTAQVPMKVQVVDSSRWDSSPSLFGTGIDLVQDCAIRASLLQKNPAEHALRIDFHGALCDAPAVLRYFDDVMAAYAFEHGAERTVDAKGFSERHMEVGATRHVLPLLAWTVRATFDVIALLVASLRAPKAQRLLLAKAPSQVGDRLVRTVQLTAEQTDTLDSVSRRAGGSLIDPVLRDLAMAFKGCEAEAEARWSGDILVERNQRRGVEARSPEGNLSALSWLRLSSSDLHERASALRSVIARAGFHTATFLTLADLKVFRAARKVFQKKLGPRVAKLPLPVIFTDAGVPFASTFLPRDADGAVSARGVKVESISVVPTFWGIGAWSVGIVRYRKALRIGLRGHPAIVPVAALAQLMNHLEEQLYETASEPGRETLALDALIEAHARMSQGVKPLHALPIGKHVAPEAPRLREHRPHGAPAPEAHGVDIPHLPDQEERALRH